MDERKKKKGWKEGRKEGRIVRVGLCVKKGQKRYISRMCREVPGYLPLPKFVLELTLPTLSPVQNLVTIG